MNDKLEPLLIKAVRLILDDQYGISDPAYEALMELIFNINPNSRSLEYMMNTQNFKGRKFLEEDFELAS